MFASDPLRTLGSYGIVQCMARLNFLLFFLIAAARGNRNLPGDNGGGP